MHAHAHALNVLFIYLDLKNGIILLIKTYKYSYEYASEINSKSGYSPISKVNIGANYTS